MIYMRGTEKAERTENGAPLLSLYGCKVNSAVQLTELQGIDLSGSKKLNLNADRLTDSQYRLGLLRTVTEHTTDKSSVQPDQNQTHPGCSGWKESITRPCNFPLKLDDVGVNRAVSFNILKKQESNIKSWIGLQVMSVIIDDLFYVPRSFTIAKKNRAIWERNELKWKTDERRPKKIQASKQTNRHLIHFGPWLFVAMVVCGHGCVRLYMYILNECLNVCLSFHRVQQHLYRYPR